MTNIVYNNFLKIIIKSDINLELANTYKIALLKGYNGSPSANDTYTFNQLALAGYQCVDTESYEGYGYEAGGKYVQLTKIDKLASDNTVDYTCNSIQWNHVNLTGDNSIMYAVLYRESDGLLISLYDLEGPLSVDDDTVKLDWKGSSILYITTEGTVKVEDSFSADSKNALMNKTITDGFNKYGVYMYDETAPISPLTNMKCINKITDVKIDAIFEELT